MTSRLRKQRSLHPVAWWIWAMGLAVAAMRTTNPLILLLLIAAAALVVAARKPATPWGRSFDFFVRLAIVILAIRVILQVLIGPSFGTTVLFALPELPLPTWFAGVRLGGNVMWESILIGLYDGLRLATLVIVFGAANSLASPTRLLKSVPAVLYEFGVSVVIAVSFTPQLVADVQRVRQARKLRGRPSTGIRGIASVAIPVFEGALEKSIALAAAMDARGYGRRTHNPHQRFVTTLLLVAVVAMVIGVYGLIAEQSTPLMGAPMLAGACAAVVLALFVAGKSATRTRYRPDPWRTPEWLVSASGVAVAAIFTIASWSLVPTLNPSTVPAQWPSLPWFAVLAFGLALSPAVTSPPLPRDDAVGSDDTRDRSISPDTDLVAAR